MDPSRRTEFDVWHSGDSLEFQMFEKDPKTGERRPVRVDQFPVASKLCNSLMTALLRELPLCQELRSKLFQARRRCGWYGDDVEDGYLRPSLHGPS